MKKQKTINILKIINIILLVAAPLCLILDRLFLMISIEQYGSDSISSSLLVDAIFFYIIFIIFIVINYLLYTQKSKFQIPFLFVEAAIIIIFLYPIESALYLLNIFITLFWLTVIINNVIYYAINKLHQNQTLQKK